MARIPGINQIVISGNIVQDAVVKHVGSNNTAVTKIRIANNQSFLNKNKEWQDKVTFIDVEVWGARAEKGEQYYKKGIPVIVEGSLKEDQWENKDGGKRSKILITANKVHLLKYPDSD